MKKKMISLCLVLGLTASMIAGCGGTGTAGGQQNAGNETAQQENAEDAGTEEAVVETQDTAGTREEALRKLRAALCELVIEGVDTNVEEQLRIVEDERFTSGYYDLTFMGNR